MTDQITTDGKCYSCNKTIPVRIIQKHLRECIKLDYDSDQALFIKVTAFESMFWLFLKVHRNCTLDSLDDFLRGIWLECCDHMSHFVIGDIHYEKDSDAFSNIMFSRKPKTMNYKIRNLVSTKTKFYYEYDYGSTTELELEFCGTIDDVGLARKDVTLLARNNDVKIDCSLCKNAATSICEMCMYEDKGFLCESCAERHQCEDCDDEPSFLPVVNSPRMGVCAYGS